MLRIKELCEQKRLQQKQVAQDLGIAASTMSQYATGSREPDFGTLNRIADYFGVSTDYLLGRTDNPSPIGEVAAAHFKDDKIFSDLTEEEQEAVRGVIAALRAKHKK